MTEAARDSAILTAALRYAARGWPVFPCSPENKRPLVPTAAETRAGFFVDVEGERHDVVKGEGGLKLASCDARQIRAWWTRWPNAMIGMPTGETVGVAVVDLDPRLVPADAMLRSLATFCGPGALPPAPLVRTQSRGLHLWFAYPLLPVGEKLGNRAGLFAKFDKGVAGLEETIREHVDIRGEGGYVILPPSRMNSGNLYDWEQTPFDLGDAPFPPMPTRLLDAVLKRGEFAPKSKASPAGERRAPSRVLSADERVRKYGLNALAMECAELARTPEGRRHDQLNLAAFNLGTLVGAGALSENTARSEIEASAQWPGSVWTQKEADTLEDGLRAGMARPRDLSGLASTRYSRPPEGEAREARPLSSSPASRTSLDDEGARSSPAPSSSAPPPSPLEGDEADASHPREDGDREPDAFGGGRGGEARARIHALLQDGDLLWRAIEQPQNDTGNGQRLMIWFGGELCFIRGVGWAAWAGTHWSRDDGPERAWRLAQLIGPLIEEEADALSVTRREKRILEEAAPYEGKPRGDLDDFAKSLIIDAGIVRKQLEDRKKTRRRFAIGTGNAGKIKAMLECAEPHCTQPIDAFDADPLAFNCLNGTLKFARVEDIENANSDEPRWTLGLDFGPHDKADLIGKVAPVIYDPEATCPRFLAFVERFLPKVAVREFVQTYFGYGLTGISSAQLLAYFYGGGANGKSVFIETMARVFGAYLQMLPVESISGEGQRRGDQANPEFARLPGARIVRVSELEKGMKLKEALIKALTGGEPMLARGLHKEFFEFHPVFKGVLSSNHKPEIYQFDEGIWRRIALVHWEVTIPLEERRDFETVVGELASEASGILNWLIGGLRRYMEQGLRLPAEVQAATAAHRDDMDPVARYVRHCVSIVDGIDCEAELKANPDFQPPEEARVYARAVFDGFNRYMIANGLRPWSEKAFSMQLAERAQSFGFMRFEKRVRYYAPCRLHAIPAAENPAQSDPGWQPPD